MYHAVCQRAKAILNIDGDTTKKYATVNVSYEMTADAGPKKRKKRKDEPAAHLHARAFLKANGIGVSEICWVLPDAIWYTTKIDAKQRTAWTRKREDEDVQEIALEDGFPTWPGPHLAWRRAVKVA